jgi:ferredoxin
VRIEIHRDRCIGAGQCVRVAPQVFTQDEDEGLVVLLDENPPPELHDAVRTAAKLCPARVIICDEEENLMTDQLDERE